MEKPSFQSDELNTVNRARCLYDSEAAVENHEFVSERVPQPYHTLDKWRVEASDSMADTWSRVPL